MHCGCSSESHSPLAVLSEGECEGQPCGGCAHLSGVGKCRLAHRVSGLGLTTRLENQMDKNTETGILKGIIGTYTTQIINGHGFLLGDQY